MRLIVSGKTEFKPRIAENGERPSFETVQLETDNLIHRFKQVASIAKEGQFIMAAQRADTLLAIESLKQKAGLVIFEAHVGALFAAETGSVKHDFFLKHLVESIPPSRIILVGLREFLYSDELAFIRQHKIRYYSMKTIAQETMQSICDTVMELAKDWPLCYVSIGLDVLDPVFASVERPSIGGMTTRELFYFIQRLRMMHNFYAADIVESEKNLELSERLLSELAAKP